MSFPETEPLVQAMLHDLGWVCTEIPDADDVAVLFAAWTPVIMVTRVGGSDDGVTDRAEVDVEVLAATRAQARSVSTAVRDRVREFEYGGMVGDVYVDYAVTTVAGRRIPAEEDHDDRVVMTTIRVDTRPPLF